MKDWNVVVTAYAEGGRQVLRTLRRLGRAERSGHYNVFVAAVDDPMALLDALEARASSEPVLIDTISRIAPAQAGFDYADEEELERRVVEAAGPWLPRLAGKGFHVRIHRRGDGAGAGGTQAEEARIGQLLLAELARAGTSGRIVFDDPDFVLSIDTVDGRAGLGLWSRQDLQGRRFLRPD